MGWARTCRRGGLVGWWPGPPGGWAGSSSGSARSSPGRRSPTSTRPAPGSRAGCTPVHAASTPLLSLFTVHPKRGVVAMDAAGVLPGFGGVAVHDCWSPYWRYPTATHALCAAHLLRELEAAAELPGQGWAAELAEWFAIACAKAADARDSGADRLEATVLAGLRDRYDRILAAGRAANPPPPCPPGRRRRRRSPAACLLGRLAGHRDEVLRFLEDLRVPPTNNQAEVRHEVACGEWTRRKEGRPMLVSA